MIGFSPKEYERCWQQIIREGIESGEFRAESRHSGRFLRPAGNAELALQMVRSAGRGLSVQEVAEQFTALALAGLAAAHRRDGAAAVPSRRR